MKTLRTVAPAFALALFTSSGLVWSDDPLKVETVKTLWSNGMVMEIRDVVRQEGKRVNHGHAYLFYQDNGRLKEDVNYDHGKRSGEAIYLHRTGLPAHQCRYIDDRCEGWATWWNDRGVLFREAHFRDNRLDGESIYYYDDGRKTLVEQWKEGVKEGPWVWYFPNGVKGIEGSYVQDVQVGVWKYWNEQGEPTESRQYNDKGELLNSPKLNPPEASGDGGGEQLGPIGPMR